MLARRGYYERMYDQHRQHAWMMSLHLGIWSKEPITPGMLLGQEGPTQSFMDRESMRAAMRAKKARANYEDL